MAAKKRLKRETLKRKTVGALTRRQQELARARRARYRAKFSLEDRRQMAAADMARCCDLAWLKSMCEVDPETGCWLWQGPWRRVFQAVRPEARRGERGSMDAAKAAFLASGRAPLPARYSLGRRCGRGPDCIAPHHLVVENAALRAAKRRSDGHGEEEGLRARTG